MNNKNPMPKFPLKCVACRVSHNGGIEQAIDDGWNFTAIETKSDGVITIAGCPKHFKEFHDETLRYLGRNEL